MKFGVSISAIVMTCCIFATACSHKLSVSKSSSTLYPITKNSPIDSQVLSFYKPYKSAIDSQINAVIAVAEKDLKRGRPEGALNNLVTDAMNDAAKARNIDFDFVHSNYKSLRVSIPAGNIRAFKIFELMPFENYLVTVKLKGTDVLDLFNYMASQGGDPVAGASFKIRDGKAYDIFIKGKAFDITQSYTVLTSDYMANAGDKAEVYRKGFDRKDDSLKLRDAILLYLKNETAQGRTINPKIEGRITSDKPGGDE